MPPLQIDVLSTRLVARLTDELRDSRPRASSSPVPRVQIVPFVAEQGSKGHLSAVGPLTVSDVVARCRRSLHDAAQIESLPVPHEIEDSHFWGSSFAHFLSIVWPLLAPTAVVVSHGNFLRKQVCGEQACARAVPNGAVIRGRDRSKEVYFVRHCTTCHNINKKGSAALTMCHDFDALAAAQQLVRALSRAHGSALQVYSSPMPRAVVTAIALQRSVEEPEREAFCDVFGACQHRVRPEEVREYTSLWACDRARNSVSPFCR